MTATENPLPALVSLLRNSRHILVFTGAGISTASGIPDYRGPQGVWKTRRPVYYQEFMTTEQGRVTYWQQKSEDWQAFASAAPNPTHRALRALQDAGRLGLLVTQNIDGLHAAAGITADKLVEIHGTNAMVECQTCQQQDPAGPYYERFLVDGVPHVCACGGLLKPATISFGQGLRSHDLQRAFTAADHADLVLSLGSTLSVTPAADIPLAGAQRGAPYVIINQGPTEHDHLPIVTLRIEGDIAAVLPPAVAEALA